MNYKELCDFKTINESIELKKQKGNIQKEDDKEYVCNSKNENAKNIEQLLNNISKSLHNRGRKDKFKRVWTSFLGFWSNKAGQYSANLNKALQEVREYVKEILDGNPRFQIEFAELKNAVKEDLDYNRIFPRYITYYKKDGANDEKDGTKSFKIWASDIQDFFKNYSNKRERIINEIEKLENKKQIIKANSEEDGPISRAIEILQDCLDRGIWIAAAALLSNIKEEDMVAVINESYLPLARTYQVLDGIGEKTASLQKAIKDADIPFFSKELDAVDKYCKGKGVNLDSAISTLKLKAEKEKTDQEVEDLEILENLSQKLSACKAAYQLRNAKCVSASEVSCGEGIGNNIKEIAEYGDNAKYDPSEKNAVVRMANKEIKKKQSKIRLGVFISIVIFFLVVAIFSAFKPGIKYAIGREIVAEVDGCEYTYRKFDDTGVEIVAAKMPEGISEYTVIPEIDGHKVVALSEGVFEDYNDFESVYIGKDIVQVGSNAFARKDNARITIYCEAQAKPDAWAKDWANDNVVVWGWTDSQQNIEITWGNLRFVIDKGKEQAAILGLSSEAKSDKVDEIEIPSNVTYESEEYAVVRVADEAFKDAAYICKIVFEEENNAITDIGFGAFEGCSSLTDIAIPFAGAKADVEENTTHFGYIFGADGSAKNADYVPTTLESVTIYGGIIAVNAFDGCSNLQNIVLGNSVKSIAQGALNGCNKLHSLTLPFVGGSNDGDIKDAFFGYIFGAAEYKQNNDAVPESLKAVELTGNCDIANYAFYNCKNITTITINSGKSIGDSAFANCTSLERLFVPDEIEKFGNGVLSGCNNIKYNDWLGTKYIGSQNSNYLVLIAGANVEGKFTTNGDTRIIAENAFKDCTTIIEISITENVIMIGDSAFANCANLPAVDFATGSSLKTIGQYAFANCTSITNIAIPDSVITIYDNAFKGCSSLDTVNFDATSRLTELGAGVFADCQALQNITIPNAVTSIKNDSFNNCNNLTSIVIPKAVIEIGDNAFKNCSKLSSVTFSEDSVLETIGQSAFEGCGVLSVIALPDKISSISTRAFANCAMVTDLIIPANVTFVGDAAFEGCNAITNITMPTIAIEYISKNNLQTVVINGGEELPASAFENCTLLSNLTIANGIARIGYNAFKNCSKLTAVTFSEDSVLETIGQSAFEGCGVLTIIALPDKVSSIGTRAFANCVMITDLIIPANVTFVGDAAFEGCNAITNITMPMIAIEYISKNNLQTVVINGGEELPASAFENCTLLSNLTIANGIARIGSNGFFNCINLSSIKIPTSVLKIGDSAFESCINLEKIVFDEGVQEIGNRAFFNCKALTTISLPRSVISIGEAVLGGCANLEAMELPYVDKNFDQYGRYHFGYIFGSTPYEGSVETQVINSSAYYYIPSKLEEVTIIGGEVPYGVFYKCTGLTKVNIGDEVVSICEAAFLGCKALSSITIGKKVTFIGSSAFSGCSNLVSVTIGNNVNYIGDSAFSNCSALTDIIIPNSVLSIGNNAFYNCNNLSNIIIGDNVNYIGNLAFYSCNALTEIIIPDKVASIGEGVLSGCSSLESLVIPFVGEKADIISEDSHYYTFGYIFGTASYEGGELTIQETDKYAMGYYIPSVLQTVRITCGNILSGAFYNCSNLLSVIIGDNVNYIGNSAFYNCSALSDIVIPNNVTSIGNKAFYNCSNLLSVRIGDNVNYIGDSAFYNCSALTDIVIPNNVTSIGEEAFYNCESFKQIIIPNNVISIGSSALGGCGSLERLTIPFVGREAGLTPEDIYQYPFGYIFGTASYVGGKATTQYYYGRDTSSLSSLTYYIPSSLKTVIVTGGHILYGAFYNCNHLVTIKMRDGVLSIGEKAFYECYSLKNIEFGNTVLEIGEQAFSFCNSLTNVNIGKSITNIGKQAFGNCINLASLVISNSVIMIGDGAFNSCVNLTDVIIGSSVQNINYRTFYKCTKLTNIIIDNENPIYYSIGKCVIDRRDKTLVLGGALSVIPEDGSVLNIGSHAFANCTGLENIKIPNSIKSIGIYAFSYCSSLTSIIIPDSVTNIGWFAFEYCTNLTNVTIGNSIANMGHHAFFNCSKLTNVTIGDSLISIENYAFSGCSNLTNVTFENTQGWQVSTTSNFSSYTELSSSDLADATIAATYLKDTYYNYYWRRVE